MRILLIPICSWNSFFLWRPRISTKNAHQIHQTPGWSQKSRVGLNCDGGGCGATPPFPSLALDPGRSGLRRQVVGCRLFSLTHLLSPPGSPSCKPSETLHTAFAGRCFCGGRSVYLRVNRQYHSRQGKTVTRPHGETRPNPPQKPPSFLVMARVAVSVPPRSHHH